MRPDLADRLRAVQPQIKLYLEHNINPLNSEYIKIKRIYEDITGDNFGSCGSCIGLIMDRLNDLAKTEKIWE